MPSIQELAPLVALAHARLLSLCYLMLFCRTVATLIVRGHMHSAPCTTSDPWVSRADGTSIATSSGQGPPRQVPGRYSTADAVQQYKERIAQREQSRSIQFSVCMERLGEDAVLQVLRLQAHPQYGDLDALQYTLQYSIRPWRKSTSMQRHGVLQRRAVATTAAEKSMQGIDAEASAQLTTSLQLHALQEHLQYHIKLLHALLQPNGQLAAPAALTATASHPLGASPPSGQYASHTSPSGATYADAATAASVPQPCAGQPPFLGVARTLSALNVVSRRVVLSKLPAFEMLAEELQVRAVYSGLPCAISWNCRPRCALSGQGAGYSVSPLS